MIEMFLKRVRKEGYTQKEIAEKCGVSNFTISDYESGRCKPSVDVLIKLADAFGVSVDAVLGREEFVIEENKRKRWTRKVPANSKANPLKMNLI